MRKRIYGSLAVVLMVTFGFSFLAGDACAETITLSVGGVPCTVTFDGFDGVTKYTYSFQTGTSAISNIDLEVPAVFSLTTSNVRVSYAAAGTSSWTPTSWELFAPGVGDSGTKLGTGDKRYWVVKVNASSRNFPANFRIQFDFTGQSFPLGVSPQVMLLKSGNGAVWDSKPISGPDMAAAAAPVVSGFLASQNPVQQTSDPESTCTDLSWSQENVTSASITYGGTTIPGVSSPQKVCPLTTTTYTLKASGAGGTTTASTTINVIPIPGAPTDVKLWADNTLLVRGQCTTLRWSSSGATSGTITPIGPVLPSGTATECPTTTTTYTFTATNSIGTPAYAPILVIAVDDPPVSLIDPIVTTTIFELPNPLYPEIAGEPPLLLFKYLRGENNCIFEVQRDVNGTWVTIPWESARFGGKRLLNCGTADSSGRCNECLVEWAGTPHQVNTVNQLGQATLVKTCLTGEKKKIEVINGKAVVTDCWHSTSTTVNCGLCLPIPKCGEQCCTNPTATNGPQGCSVKNNPITSTNPSGDCYP